MKTLFQGAAALLLLCTLNNHFSTAIAQGTAFTYQGQLQIDGSPASGTYAMTFALFNANASGVVIAPPITNNAVSVTNGLFITTIDFGAGVFSGVTNWLQIGVATNGVSSFTPLSPRQQLTPTPYAIFASTANAAGSLSGTIASANFSGTYGNAVTLNNAGNSFSGSYTGDGANLTSVNAAALNGLNATNFWQLSGNNVSSSQFFGSTNDLPVRIRVNNQRALIITTNPVDSANLIAGSPANAIDDGIEGAVIAGGGTTNFLGASSSNHISANFDSIGGGSGNWIQGGSDHAVIGNGWNNLIAFNSYQSVIAGGENNTISNVYAVIGGGMNNTNSSYVGTISGGQNNLASGQYQSTVGGGYGNQATNSYATVPGGAQNLAGGELSFAAGQMAEATNQGAFVWADAEGTPFNSTANNQFNVRANGGVRFVTGGAGLTLDGQSVLTNNQINPTFSGTVTAAIFASGNGNFVAGEGNTVIGEDTTVAGGTGNSINALFAAIGGGGNNVITGPGDVIDGGGFDGIEFPGNTASGIASVIGGGAGNQATANEATVSGGYYNDASANYATVPGGYGNTASGMGSFAAGQQANATNQGTFVWADAEGTPFNSTANNQFNVRANGGVRFVTGGAGLTLDGQSVLTNNQINPTFSGTVTAAIFASGNGNFVAGEGNTVIGEDTTVAGGTGNSINALFAAIGGGGNNVITGPGDVIDGGGFDGIEFPGNTASGIASVIGGGAGNQATANEATVSGGYYNDASANYATVPGGYGNTASGMGSFAAGQQANATNQGAFVWADSQNAVFSSTTNDQFLIRAQGGVGIGTSTTIAGGFTLNTNMYLSGHALYLRGVDESGANQNDHNHGLAYCGPGVTNFAPTVLPDGPVLWGYNGGVLGVEDGGAHSVLSWTNGGVSVTGSVFANGLLLTSDRNAKENFTALDTKTVLAKVAALPVTQWNYKTDNKGVQHIGPMAQDFQAAFGLDGADDKHISLVDEGGVALAAIQGLNQKMELEAKEKDAEIQVLKSQNDSLTERVNELDATVKRFVTQK